MVDVSSSDGHDPSYFDRFTPAADLQIEGLREQHLEIGIGAPLVAFRANESDEVKEDQVLDDYYPPEGIVRPLTAVLYFDTPDAPRLALYDPRRIKTVTLSPPPPSQGDAPRGAVRRPTPW